MTATKTTFDPYSVTLMITSTENFYLSRSSNGFDVYGLIMTGEYSAVCSCPAGSIGVNCRHRKALLARFVYATPNEVELTAQQVRAHKAALVPSISNWTFEKEAA